MTGLIKYVILKVLKGGYDMKKFLSGPSADGLFISVSGNLICVPGSAKYFYYNGAVIQNGDVIFDNVDSLEKAASLVFSIYGGRRAVV